MVDNTADQVIEIIRQVTKDPLISLTSTQLNTTGWDSLAYLVIAQEIENKFQIVISADNIDQFSSVNGIVKLILDMKD